MYEKLLNPDAWLVKMYTTIFFLHETKQLVRDAKAICFLNVYTSALGIFVSNPLGVGQGCYCFNSRPLFLCDCTEVRL